MLRLVVTDWDGTFAEQGSSPLPGAIKAKDELISKGILVVLVSGRSAQEVVGYIKEYKLSPEFIAELGTVVYHDRKELINHGDLRKHQGAQLYSEFVHYLDQKEVSAHDAMFYVGVVDKVLEEAQKRGRRLRIFTPKDGRPGEEGTNLMKKKGTVLMRGVIKIDAINRMLDQEAPFLEVKDNGLVEDNSGDHAYHLVIKGANKESAVKMLQQLLNIKQEESIALGDSLSDLSLVSAVDRFYLMRNGLNHTPDMLDRFRRSLTGRLSPAEIEQVMKRIEITEAEAGLGWAEAVNRFITSPPGRWKPIFKKACHEAILVYCQK